MIDFILQAWDQFAHRTFRRTMEAGGGGILAAGRKTKPALWRAITAHEIQVLTFGWRRCCGRCRRVLGEENLALSVMSQNLDWSRGYFGDARQVFLPDIYPPFLYREVRKHHGVIACEARCSRASSPMH